jgi:excisionase family DNA binding protein
MKGEISMDPDKLVLSVNEAAHALSLSPWTVRAYIAAGRLKAVRIGRRVLVEPSELQRIIESGRKPDARGSRSEGGVI